MPAARNHLVPCPLSNVRVNGKWVKKAYGTIGACEHLGHMLKDGLWWHQPDREDSQVLSSSEQDPVTAPILTGASGRVLTVYGYTIGESPHAPAGFLWFLSGEFLVHPNDMRWLIEDFERGAVSMSAIGITGLVSRLAEQWKSIGSPDGYARVTSLGLMRARRNGPPIDRPSRRWLPIGEQSNVAPSQPSVQRNT